jgi:hypothetical protein
MKSALHKANLLLDQLRTVVFGHALNGTWTCRSLAYRKKNTQAKQ